MQPLVNSHIAIIYQSPHILPNHISHKQQNKSQSPSTKRSHKHWIQIHDFLLTLRDVVLPILLIISLAQESILILPPE